MTPRFIRVTKDNTTKDRGIIAVDAICSVFENRDSHNVSIMTMDGFWYDVVDDIDKLCHLLSGASVEKGEVLRQCESTEATKKEYFTRKKMLLPTCSEKAPRKAEDGKAVWKGKVDIVGRPWQTRGVKKPKKGLKNLPTGVGEEHQIETNPSKRECGQDSVLASVD